MEDIGRVKLNTLNHDLREQYLEFSFQGYQGNGHVTLVGRVPLVMHVDGDVRQIAKDTVRQLLMEAIEALEPVSRSAVSI